MTKGTVCAFLERDIGMDTDSGNLETKLVRKPSESISNQMYYYHLRFSLDDVELTASLVGSPSKAASNLELWKKFTRQHVLVRCCPRQEFEVVASRSSAQEMPTEVNP